MSEQRYRKMVLTLAQATWTTVTAPIDCNDVWIKSRDSNTVRESTDINANGNSSYDIIQPGVLQNLGLFTLVNSGSGYMFGNTRFKKGDFITNLAGDTGSATCVVTFVL